MCNLRCCEIRNCLRHKIVRNDVKFCVVEPCAIDCSLFIVGLLTRCNYLCFACYLYFHGFKVLVLVMLVALGFVNVVCLD